MSHRARHQLLALPGIIFLVLFPIILSLWIAFLWAKSEVNNQLRTFAQLALDKSELVIRQADLVSDAAETLSGASLLSSPSKANVKYYSWLSLY
ncbi:putative EAL domain protein regulator [Escherichia coli]|nr:putative EAL domain protein regulator [Escherichia coli]